MSTTLPPTQKLVGPFAVTFGGEGFGNTVTVTAPDDGEVHPLTVVVTLYVPELLTRIDGVFPPFDQVLPVEAEEVNATLPPVQNVVGPLLVIVGAGGIVLTVTVTGTEAAEVHPPAVAVTENVPELETVMDGVRAPFDHVLPVDADEVNVTVCPVHNVVEPLVEMVGTDGVGFTVTVIGADADEVQPFVVTVAEYVPELVTVIDGVVPPFDQLFPLEEDEVSTTLFPEQNVVGPPAVIVGAAGVGLTVTTVGVELTDGQLAEETDTVYVPLEFTVMDCVVSPVDHVLLVDEEDVSTTFCPEQIVVDPLAEIVGVGGAGFTVIVIGLEV